MTVRTRLRTVLAAGGALVLAIACSFIIANAGFQMLNGAEGLSAVIEPLYVGLATFFLAISPLLFLSFGYYCVEYIKRSVA